MYGDVSSWKLTEILKSVESKRTNFSKAQLVNRIHCLKWDLTKPMSNHLPRKSITYKIDLFPPCVVMDLSNATFQSIRSKSIISAQDTF